MATMISGDNDYEMAVFQLSFGGFDRSANFTAREFSDYLEESMCASVCECKLKKSWTPPESYPDFHIQNAEHLVFSDHYEKVVPHAFVHFLSADSVAYVLNAARCGDLYFHGLLHAIAGPQSPRCKKKLEIPLLKFSGVSVDIGVLVGPSTLLVGWSGPCKKFDFAVEKLNGSCKLYFTRDTVFSFKDDYRKAKLTCRFKLEFSVTNIAELKTYEDGTALVILIRLSSSPLVSYRTEEDDVYDELSLGDLPDDDDPWIRTTDFTPSGVIGRCDSYRIVIPIRYGGKLKRVVGYFGEKGIRVKNHKEQLRVEKEPNFGALKTDPFFCIQYEIGVSFEVTFLMNCVVHKGIINQHQLSMDFFDIIRSQSEKVIVAALRQMFLETDSVSDAPGRLKLIQEQLLKNPELLKCPEIPSDLIEVMTLVITPTRAYCLPPDRKLSNRVIQHYRHASHRFLRVNFMDDGMQELNSNALECCAAPILGIITWKTSIFERKNSILKQGFYLCGRLYTFLAFPSNPLEQNSAWFFAEDKNDMNLTVQNIRKSMEMFTNKNVAECAAPEASSTEKKSDTQTTTGQGKQQPLRLLDKSQKG